MKEQDRNSQDRINEEEINRFPKTEFRLMIVKVPQSLENRMETMQEKINTVTIITKDTEEIKNKQTEMNNTITEIKNILEGTNSRITEGEEWISEVEVQMVKITVEEENKGKKNEKN